METYPVRHLLKIRFHLLFFLLGLVAVGCGNPAPQTVTLSSIAVTPNLPSINVGSGQQFTATGTYSNGSTADITGQVTWTSSATSVATISASGMATGVAVGTSMISAALSSVTGSDMLTVSAAPPPTLTSIAVTPATPSIAAGATQQFTATGTYSNSTTQNITSSVTWTSGTSSVATISSAGLATGVTGGTSTITAALSGVSGSTTLTVTSPPPPTLTSIAVTPASPSIAAGATQQFTATGTYSNSTTQNITSSVTWTSGTSSVATISSAGLATGVAAGTSTIKAASGSVSGSTTLTVTAASTGTVNITTWHVDTNRSGLNSNETILTPTNVVASGFGKKFSYLTDGYVYGEPLIMSGVTINGTKHDVLYVATENDSVYAFDADSYGTGAPLWQVSLLQSGETALTGGPIAPVQGVTSTPVIDATTNTLYVVSTEETSSASTFRLSALDITTGAQKFGGPVTITATVSGTGDGGTTESLNTSCVQRAALLEANGNIYIGFGGCAQGWLLAYNAATLAQVGAFNASPILDGEGTFASAGGIWMGGGGPVADSSGNVYVSTGNGPWNGTNAWGDSVLKFPKTIAAGANGTMQPSDYFTPSIYQFMDCYDADLAAGGLLLVPGTTTLIAGGKTGTMYLLNSTNLGHETSNDAGAIQEQVWGEGLASGSTYSQSCTDSTGTNTANIASYEIFGTTAYFDGYVYLGVTPTGSPAPGGVRQFAYSGTLTADANTTPAFELGTRGISPFISANGENDGIVWTIDQGFPLQNSATDGSASTTPPTAATLRAYSVASYPNELYDSTQNGTTDVPGYGIKFSSPVVANGKVYISTGHTLTTGTAPMGEIDVYGLK